SLVFRSDPGRAEGCDLQPLAEPPVTLSYTTSTVPRGCVSGGSRSNGSEVHVLNVKWSKVSNQGASPECCPPSTVPLALPYGGVGCMLPPSPRLRLSLTSQDAHLSPGITTAPHCEQLVATGEEQLLAWARRTYGSITSYSELRDPRWVKLRLVEDADSPSECIPQGEFDAMPHLETEVVFHEVKGCSHGDAQSTKAAHIVRLDPKPSSITKVDVSLSCPKRAVGNQFLILQSRANLTWFLSLNNCNVHFLVSGSYRITSLSLGPFPGELLPDTEQGLVDKAFEKNCSVIASYSAIPASTHISLEIQEHGEAAGTPMGGIGGCHYPAQTLLSPCLAEVTRRAPVMTTTPPTSTQSMPKLLLPMLRPWKCTDETMEIVIARSHLQPIKDLVNISLRDSSCQAEKNATHFMLKTALSHCGTSLEDRGHANNELILNLGKGAVLRTERVAFQCEIPRELFLRLFPTAAFEVPQMELEVNKEVFVQVPPPARCLGWEGGADHPQASDPDGSPSRSSISLVPRVWGLPALSPSQGCRYPTFSPQSPPLQNTTMFEKVLQVMVKDGWQPPNSRGLGLAAVLGITFGAFLIGALLTAGLWYIYSHTRPTSKLQPVSSTAPASESSSTNHSIGSTQSTPCSTSSMA
ncbi:EGLN protein, partial [Trogon melanurus]|nr:EGLN protein [Trogon melanurus]